MKLHMVTSYFLHLCIGNVVKAKNWEVPATKKSSLATLKQKNLRASLVPIRISLDKTLGAKEGRE